MKNTLGPRARCAVAVVLLLAGSPSRAQESVPDEVRRVAGQGLEQFRRLLTEQNSTELGFASPAAGVGARLGAPFREYLVRLDELAAWRPDGDAAKLLHGGDEYTFPILVGEEVRSSISIARVDGAWKPTSFGSPGRARTISEVRAAGVRGGKVAAAFSMVVVPALYVQFLGRAEAGRLQLTPVRDDQSVEFRWGVELPAEEVFRRLAPLARTLQSGRRR